MDESFREQCANKTNVTLRNKENVTIELVHCFVREAEGNVLSEKETPFIIASGDSG